MKKHVLIACAIASIAVADLRAQCSSLFDEGFESGSYTPTWTAGSAPISWAVTTTNPASGTYRLEGTGGNNTHLNGLNTTLASSTPTTISWDIFPTGNVAANYVVLGDNAVTATNCIAFCYWQGGTNIRFVSSSTAIYNCTAGQWYHVEMRNINWSAHTFDIYINNTLVIAGFAFRNSSQNSLTKIHLYNFDNTVGIWDNIRVGNTPVIASAFAGTNVSCNGGSNGSGTASATGGNGTYTYNWLPSGGTAATATGLTAGTYSCIVTDGLGCPDTTSITITEPTAITLGTSHTDLTCNGALNGDATAIPSGGTGAFTYMWSNGGITPTIPLLSGGVYTCTVTDVNGCTAVQSVTVSEPAQLQVAASGGNICTGSTATLNGTASGGTAAYTYNWMPGNLSGSTVTDMPTVATTYTLYVTDANGCNDSSTTTVAINLPPTVDLGPDTTVCLGMFLDAQNSGSTYLWNDGSTLPALGVTATGTYYVTVTDINGCSASDTVNVTVDSQPNGGNISSSGGPDVCPGDSVFLISVNDAGTLNWWVMLAAAPFWQNLGSGNPFTHGPVAIADTGIYQFMAIASNGVCPDDTSNVISVLVHVPPVVQLSDTVVCGNSVILDAGISNASYLWSDNSVQQQLAVTSSGMYSVAVTDQFGCTGSDTSNVTLHALPAVSGSASVNSVCLDDADVTLTGTPAGGSWGGPGVTGNAFDPSIGTGPQLATYTYTDTNGCTNNAVITIAVNACVGMEEQAASVFSVYPNPNNGIFNLSMNAPADKLLIDITDMQGRSVYSSAMNNVQSGNVITVDLSAVAGGTYILHVVADGSVSNHEIILTK